MLSLAFPAIDPIAISIGPIAIRWYALAYIAGLLLGWKYVVYYCTKTPNIMSKRDVDDLLFWATLGVILGGRLGYILFYNLDYYLDNPANILKVWQGGMAFHGGFMGVIVAIILFARKRNISILAVLDAAAVATPIGLFFGRIANFINGELYGRTTDVAWGFVFPNGGPEPRHPSQLYEAALEGLILFIVLFILSRKAFVRHRPGILGGTFVAGYGISRIIVEFFRQPDAQLGYLAGGITMGQVLSIPMVLAGIGCIVYALKSKPIETRIHPKEAENA
ncbi:MULTISPECIES: prolipoprotein diacylglyceryl transferase [unclassified Thalassospira]|uniref:prolipoprotein diacylglyceryl transferase n=1 Tax=unclassified Thalassospira TaxID=2648997 RepID=UPI001B233D63|nr:MULTISPECIES: prolipoprotein diacylglyceryl transferase [unclassified Thalassospira]MBO6579617.1 prolipoprotein diacylglyceryl transferase [Thalassospira sp.]MBO6802619.1 prolipoprotein diacylglyceryl transferase [Thalassospira sp.]MBO6817181.1 prolipoprotein diacylglyceryl transferase [Thalassospira sp.]MBO6888539.1 prolipoprotein diacylglyceryl transferase [Thalassospira sp.]